MRMKRAFQFVLAVTALVCADAVDLNWNTWTRGAGKFHRNMRRKVAGYWGGAIGKDQAGKAKDDAVKKLKKRVRIAEDNAHKCSVARKKSEKEAIKQNRQVESLRKKIADLTSKATALEKDAKELKGKPACSSIQQALVTQTIQTHRLEERLELKAVQAIELEAQVASLQLGISRLTTDLEHKRIHSAASCADHRSAREAELLEAKTASANLTRHAGRCGAQLVQERKDLRHQRYETSGCRLFLAEGGVPLLTMLGLLLAALALAWASWCLVAHWSWRCSWTAVLLALDRALALLPRVSPSGCEEGEYPFLIRNEDVPGGPHHGGPSGRRNIRVQCPGVEHRDVSVDVVFNGCVVTIARPATPWTPQGRWSRTFTFPIADGLFEFKGERAALSHGLLDLSFDWRPASQPSRTFRFPQHFEMAAADGLDTAWPLEDTRTAAPADCQPLGFAVSGGDGVEEVPLTDDEGDIAEVAALPCGGASDSAADSDSESNLDSASPSPTASSMGFEKVLPEDY